MHCKSILSGIMFIGTAILIVVPTQSAEPGRSTWCVAYKGVEKDSRPQHTVTFAAKKLAEYMSRVLKTEVAVSPWDKAQGEHLFLITDAKQVPSEIAQEFDGKRGDAFLIRYPYQIDGRKVCLLVAHDSKGYDFPVYEFLRRFMGVEWVGPGELGEIVPENPDWRLPDQITVLENPDFEMRHWADFTFDYARPLLAGSPRMDFHHAFGKIYPPSKYAQTDPVIYPLIDGKRYVPDPKAESTSGWQPCVGNPKVQDIAVKYVLEKFANDPSTVSVSLTVNDGAGHDCMCDLCRAMDAKNAYQDPLNPNLSDRYFRFYNLVTERVLKVQPNAYIAVLGYGPTAKPPIETRIHDRVCVFVSTGANPCQFEKAGGASALYQYHLDNAYPTIRHYPHMIADYLRESKRAGGMGYYAQIEHNWAAGGLKVYVLAHLLWNVKSDVDSLLVRYMRLAFGEEAAVPMRAYYDRWEAIWKREQATLSNPYDAISAWNGNQIEKFRFVTWEDVNCLDAAISQAQKAKMTDLQQRRLKMFLIYYQWIRCSIVQYLMGKDFIDEAWVESRAPQAILEAMSACELLTRDFDRIWEEQIAPDRTGWLLNQNPRLLRAVEQGMRIGDPLSVEPIRAEIDVHISNGIGQALKMLSDKINADKSANVAFWKNELNKRPALRPYLQTEINRLEGVKYQNLLANGDFEAGIPGTLEPGNPPKLPGWWFYDHVGMVHGAKAVYDWQEKEGHGNGRAVGCGTGKYPGLRTFAQAEAGRYRFSFWYRTVNRPTGIEVNVMRLRDDVHVENLKSVEDVRAIENAQYLKFIRRWWPSTGGEWRNVVQSFTLDKSCGLAIALEPFGMKEGEWVWFDDVELVRLY